MDEKKLEFIKDGERKRMLKCPACWQEIDESESVCPHCGFVLRSGYLDKVEIDLPSDNKSVTEPVSVINPVHQKGTLQTNEKKRSRDKAIISVAVLAIIVILAVVLIPKMSGGKKTEYSNSYSYNGVNSYGAYSNGATTGKEGALNRANSYLSHSAFSYTGLIEQLEYEGFSEYEAQYAADNCGADWKKQALKKAQSYLSHSAFSKSGLTEQLEYEGFTNEEAKYGVDNCDADWNEQAAKKAASYLSHSTFTKTELIDQLEYEGFTHEQALYGVKQNGM